MKVQIQFPILGVEVEVFGTTPDGQRVPLTGLEFSPTFFRPDAAVPLMYGRVMADMSGGEAKGPKESQRFTLVVSGRTGTVRMQMQNKAVASLYEQGVPPPVRVRKKSAAPSV